MSNSPALCRAAQAGDLAEVKRFVEAGADVNSADEHGTGALLTFDPAITAYLVAHGADPNRQTNESGAAILAGICYVNNLECARILIEQGGADVNVGRRESGETPLHLAVLGAEPERCELVKLLLEHGANPNAATIAGAPTLAFWRDVRTRGETPLHRAAAYASQETIALLLAAGADATLRDVNGDSPVSWASWHQRPWEIVEMLMG